MLTTRTETEGPLRGSKIYQYGPHVMIVKEEKVLAVMTKVKSVPETVHYVVTQKRVRPELEIEALRLFRGVYGDNEETEASLRQAEEAIKAFMKIYNDDELTVLV